MTLAFLYLGLPSDFRMRVSRLLYRTSNSALAITKVPMVEVIANLNTKVKVRILTDLGRQALHGDLLNISPRTFADMEDHVRLALRNFLNLNAGNLSLKESSALVVGLDPRSVSLNEGVVETRLVNDEIAVGSA